MEVSCALFKSGTKPGLWMQGDLHVLEFKMSHTKVKRSSEVNL